MPTPISPLGRDTYQLDRAHVFHSWSAQASVDSMVVATTEGGTVTAADGKMYLDFSSQMIYTNLGHQHPKVVQAIKDQADLLCTIAPQHAVAARSRAAQAIVSHTPGA